MRKFVPSWLKPNETLVPSSPICSQTGCAKALLALQAISDGNTKNVGHYGYGDGAYTSAVSAGEIAFESETESPAYGKLLWRGVVRGRRLDATLTMVRDGAAAGEKWILAGQV